MSLEIEVQELKSKHQSLDHIVRDLMRVVGGAHEVVSLILKEQPEIRKELIEFRKETQCTLERQDRRTDKIEELLIQIVNNLASQSYATRQLD